MIVVDIETSGADMNKCGIWQIGAVDLANPENTFLEEARLEDDLILFDLNGNKIATEELFGKSEAELRNKDKESERELIEKFFKWCSKIKDNTIVSHHPQFDFAFIQIKAFKYGMKLPMDYKCFDTHSIAQLKYLEVKGSMAMKIDFRGKILSDMGLKNLLSFVGMIDDRKEHNALEDARLTAEAFSRLVYGKNLLEDYKEFEIPEYLLKTKSVSSTSLLENPENRGFSGCSI